MWTHKKAAMPILLCVWCEHARSYCYLFSCQSCVYPTGFLSLSLYLWLCWIGCSFIVIFSLALSCLDHVLFSFFSFSCLQVISCSLRSLVSFWGSQFSKTHLFLAQLFWVVLNIRSGWPTYPSWFCQRTDKKRIPFTVVHYAENPTGDSSEWCGFVIFHAGKETFSQFQVNGKRPTGAVQKRKEKRQQWQNMKGQSLECVQSLYVKICCSFCSHRTCWAKWESLQCIHSDDVVLWNLI